MVDFQFRAPSWGDCTFRFVQIWCVLLWKFGLLARFWCLLVVMWVEIEIAVTSLGRRDPHSCLASHDWGAILERTVRTVGTSQRASASRTFSTMQCGRTHIYKHYLLHFAPTSAMDADEPAVNPHLHRHKLNPWMEQNMWSNSWVGLRHS